MRYNSSHALHVTHVASHLAIGKKCIVRATGSRTILSINHRAAWMHLSHKHTQAHAISVTCSYTTDHEGEYQKLNLRSRQHTSTHAKQHTMLHKFTHTANAGDRLTHSKMIKTCANKRSKHPALHMENTSDQAMNQKVLIRTSETRIAVAWTWSSSVGCESRHNAI